MFARFLRASTQEELIGLLQTGVRDLHFDSVEVSRNGGAPISNWVKLGKIHADNPRIVLKKDFHDLSLAVIATVPKHNSDAYQKYLESIWMEMLDSFALAYSQSTLTAGQPQHVPSPGHDLAMRSAAK